MKIHFENAVARAATFTSLSADRCEVVLGAEGGGISLAEIRNSGKRYIIGDIEVLEEHSVAMMFRCFLPGAEEERIFMRFGLLPCLKTRICLDLHLLDNSTIYTNRTPARLSWWFMDSVPGSKRQTGSSLAWSVPFMRSG
ncbi:hypothetical protein [Paenibacillus sp. DMB5]|uniref:hypothetical protein n=1 Tax=Paenibacillus sp. DMB5 TaxID=1780103 RepID=UPI00076C39DC|nr:hypothetical protein [Paenibacillus sp. DMB5]KUP21800.1 hypothetical protein AWJ19_02375 [Paenibacillus sp. DMB5]